MGEKTIWENTLALMTNNDWNLMNFGTGQQPNKCYAERVPFMITTCTKRGEQPKSHSTDGVIFDPSDSTSTGDCYWSHKTDLVDHPQELFGAIYLNLPCLHTRTYTF